MALTASVPPATIGRDMVTWFPVPNFLIGKSVIVMVWVILVACTEMQLKEAFY